MEELIKVLSKRSDLDRLKGNLFSIRLYRCAIKGSFTSSIPEANNKPSFVIGSHLSGFNVAIKI